MAEQKGATVVFPHYLPEPDPVLLRWIGGFLKSQRGKKSIQQVASATKLKPEELTAIEGGAIHHSLGAFHQILRLGYGQTLEEVVTKCYDAFKGKLASLQERPFLRDYYYAFCLDEDRNHKPTPLIVGGDPESFLWAIPIRKLERQPLVTDLLELAPTRKKKKTSGQTKWDSHDGVEVIHVIHGTVTATIEIAGGESTSRILKGGDTIHLNASSKHQVCNEGNTTSALLLVVRLVAE
jgi:hypothetical protein